MPLRVAKVAVGSTNPAKIAAVRAAMAKLAPGAAILPVEVTSGVRDQPWGETETRQGAIGRARGAIAATRAELGVGLEGGVIDEGAGLQLVSWVAVVDGDGRIGLASGLRLMLPGRARERLRAGDELGDVMDELFGVVESKRGIGAIGLLTEGATRRTDAFADLVAMACAPFLFPDLYA